jgi:hypothetical protein
MPFPPEGVEPSISGPPIAVRSLILVVDVELPPNRKLLLEQQDAELLSEE